MKARLGEIFPTLGKLRLELLCSPVLRLRHAACNPKPTLH